MADARPDSTERFSSRVDAYVAARPRYPRAVLGYLNSVIGLSSNWTIADIGSGTGISAEPFLQAGNTVFTVEPNAPMRNAAEHRLGCFPQFRSIDGTAESTTLVDHSIDLIVAAQAFHWFNNDRAKIEFARILRPGGWVLLMWNDRKLTGTPFLDAYEQLLLTFGTDYKKVRHNNIAPADLEAFFTPGTFKSAGFPNHQHLDFSGLSARLLSSSYVPQDSPQMLQRLRDIFDRNNTAGRVTIEYQTALFLGQLT